MRISPILLWFCLPAGVFGQEIRFIGEDLTFRLSAGSFRVEGTYYFVNTAARPVERMIYYPVGGDVPFDSATVVDLGKNREEKIPVSGAHGWSFSLNAGAGDTAVYYIAYRQPLSADSAVYILRTTRLWNRPLESAVYTLITDGRFPAVSCSYPPDTVYYVEGSAIYRWQKKNFFPEKDMIFHFKIP